MTGQTAKGYTSYKIRAMKKASVPPWATAIHYLLRHEGRWVTSTELGDFVYGSYYSEAAPRILIHRARQAGVIVESSCFGYRMRRHQHLACPDCGLPRVAYGRDEYICYSCVGTQFVDLEVGRTPYAEGSRGGKPWTDEETDLALSLNETHTFEQIGALLDRSGSAVRGHFDSLGVEKKYAMGKRAGGEGQ